MMKHKRILAVVLAAVIVLGGTMTGQAAESDTDTEHGIMTLASYESYHKSYDYGSLDFSSSSDGYSASEILSQAVEYIVANEGNYTTVLKSDVGKGLSIGKIGWHADNALLLLQLIVSEDNATAYNTLGATLYEEITTHSESYWADDTSTGKYRILTDSEATAIENLLGTTKGKEVQDKLAESYVKYYLNNGWALGLRKGAALVDYADMENQYGYYQTVKDGAYVGGAHLCATYAINLAGSASAVTLNDMHIAGVLYVATNEIYTERGDYYLNAYIERRRTVYGKLVSAGWKYGDYVIPYSASGTEGAAWLKKTLNSYCGAGLTVNSNYDDALTSAIKSYQKSVGYSETGTADLKTTTRLIYDMYYYWAATGKHTELSKHNGVWTYMVNGNPDYTYTGLVKNENGWWYVQNGVVKFNYNGFAENGNGKWYVENSKVTFEKNSVIKDTTGAIGTKGTWYYVVGSKVQTSFTGLADYRNSNGWWYIKNGKVDFTHNGVDKNKNGWWYVTGGKVRFGFTGLANYKNKNGWWYIKKGKVDFTHNGVDKNKNGWWYVTDGKVQFGFTGLANYRNTKGWWYIKDGKVDFTHNGVDKNKNGWWYVTGGKVRFGFTGLANYKNKNGWWYIKKGKVDFSHNGVDKNKNGWWYVTDGKVQFGFTGLADYRNTNGWWYIKKGKVDFSYNGLASNKNGVWYLKKGKVNFSFSSTYTIGDTTYTLKSGKVVLASHEADQTLTAIDRAVLTTKKGSVLSRTLTQSEFNQLINKFMSSSYVKNTAYNSTSGGFVWNGGTRWDCSSMSLYFMNDYLLTYDEAYQAAKKANASAGTSSLISSALAAVGKKANGAYPETGSAAPTNSVSQAMSWGNPVYTYKTVSQISSGSPGSLRYGDLLFYGSVSGSTIKISHVAVYLGQYYSDKGDEGYYQLENDDRVQGSTKEGRSDGVRISPLRTTNLVHVARIF